ncbi:MAG: hypothetical protein ABH846_02520, partial [Patescibacteria group bacterium]
MFVKIERLGRDDSNSVVDLEKVIGILAETAGALVIDELVDEEEVEADFAFVITVETALRFIKETEHTVVFIG